MANFEEEMTALVKQILVEQLDAFRNESKSALKQAMAEQLGAMLGELKGTVKQAVSEQLGTMLDEIKGTVKQAVSEQLGAIHDEIKSVAKQAVDEHLGAIRDDINSTLKQAVAEERENKKSVEQATKMLKKQLRDDAEAHRVELAKAASRIRQVEGQVGSKAIEEEAEAPLSPAFNIKIWNPDAGQAGVTGYTSQWDHEEVNRLTEWDKKTQYLSEATEEVLRVKKNLLAYLYNDAMEVLKTSTQPIDGEEIYDSVGAAYQSILSDIREVVAKAPTTMAAIERGSRLDILHTRLNWVFNSRLVSVTPEGLSCNWKKVLGHCNDRLEGDQKFSAEEGYLLLRQLTSIADPRNHFYMVFSTLQGIDRLCYRK